MPEALSVLSEEEALFQASVRQFARERVAPHVRAMDESGVFRKDLLKDLFDLGLMSIDVPEDLGGQGGTFFQAILAIEELAKVGRAFQGVPQLANVVEGGGQTPVLPPDELFRLGFAMALYPTTVLFRVAHTIERALADLKSGKAMESGEGVDFSAFKDITGYADWARIEETYKARINGN